MSHPAKTCCFPCGCMLNYSCKDDAELWELLRSGAIRRYQDRENMKCEATRVSLVIKYFLITTFLK